MKPRRSPSRPTKKESSARLFSKTLTIVGIVGVLGLLNFAGTFNNGSGPFESQRAEGYSVQYPNVAGCPINKRFSNWGTFVQNGISATGFTSNWADIFTKNNCHINDIFSLQDALDGAQNQLRQKIFACQEASIAPLVQKVNDLKFEIEYVRHIIDTDEEQPSPDGGSKALVRKPAQLRQLLNDSVVVQRKLISTERFNALFAQFEKKYESRIALYRDCKSQDWEALRESWNSFTESWAGLSPAWNKMKTQTSAKVDALKGPVFSKNFLKGVLDVRLNNVDPAQTLTGIYQKLQENTKKSGPSPDFLNTISGAEQDSGRFYREKEIAERKAYYELLYKHFGDTAGNAMIKETQKMNSVIESTLKVMDGVRSCTKYTADRQCGGK